MTSASEDDTELITRNASAHHNYFVDDEYEAGVKLVRTEIESLEQGRVDLTDAYASFEDRELYLVDAHIPQSDRRKVPNHDPDRPRKLLLRRKQLNRLQTRVEQSGYTLIPLALYFKESHVKARLGVCQGKKQFHKQLEVDERKRARKRARDHAERLDDLEHAYEEHSSN
jgi:SsrA-binding protein